MNKVSPVNYFRHVFQKATTTKDLSDNSETGGNS